VPGRSVSAATLNRDFAALGAFLTWLRDIEGVAVERTPLPRERESSGRERWLSAEELAAFETACPDEWWPFFATLFYTGARLGEVQGLRGADVLLSARRISIHEADRRAKTREAVRDLPIAGHLERALAKHLTRVGPGAYDLRPRVSRRLPALRRHPARVGRDLHWSRHLRCAAARCEAHVRRPCGAGRRADRPGCKNFWATRPPP
jgi:integrase